jgi:hypothetical protein
MAMKVAFISARLSWIIWIGKVVLRRLGSNDFEVYLVGSCSVADSGSSLFSTS